MATYRLATCLDVAFAFVVDDFAINFKDLVNADHLITCLELYYKLTIKKNATKYLDLTIEVDKVVREVRISAPGVIAKVLQHFAPDSTVIARSPAVYKPPRFGKEAQTPSSNTSPLLTAAELHRLRQIGGVLLYYCLAVDSTGLPAVTAIVSAF